MENQKWPPFLRLRRESTCSPPATFSGSFTQQFAGSQSFIEDPMACQPGPMSLDAAGSFCRTKIIPSRVNASADPGYSNREIDVVAGLGHLLRPRACRQVAGAKGLSP